MDCFSVEKSRGGSGNAVRPIRDSGGWGRIFFPCETSCANHGFVILHFFETTRHLFPTRLGHRCGGHLGRRLGPSWGHLGAILGPSWGHRGAIVGPSGPISSQSWGSWGHLGPSWENVGLCWTPLEHVGASWSILGPSRGYLGPFWGRILHLRPFCGTFWLMLGPCWGYFWAVLGLSWVHWSHMEAMLGQV
jgi:hypothetical protein